MTLAGSYFEMLNQYYDHIYVISVEAAADRRKKFTEHFPNLKFEFFFGADKSKFTIEDAKAKNIYSEKLTQQHHRFNKSMKHGEIACALSHRMIYEDMLNKKYERVMIFEDDALPDNDRISQIPFVLDQFPTDGELLLWGWAKNGSSSAGTRIKQSLYHLQHRMGKLKWDNTIIRNLFAKTYSSHLKTAGFHDYAHAYGITRSAAEKLVVMQTPIQYIADNLLAHAATREIVKGYIAFPQVILHDNLPDGTHRDSYIR